MSTTEPTPFAAGMLCPRCRVDLLMSDRQGVEIDYCPKCRGIWLDRGEIDKIVERSEQQAIAAMQGQAPAATPPSQSVWTAPSPPSPGWGDRHGAGHGGHGGDHYDNRGGRHSWLGRLFD